MHDGMRTSGLTHKPSLELETGLKYVSGQGEYSVNQKHLMFPTGVVYPLSKILMFGDNYFPHWLAHSGSQPFMQGTPECCVSAHRGEVRRALQATHLKWSRHHVLFSTVTSVHRGREREVEGGGSREKGREGSEQDRKRKLYLHHFDNKRWAIMHTYLLHDRACYRRNTPLQIATASRI